MSMPVPIRDNGQSGPEKRLLVLVHGFNSSEATWDLLGSRLLSDSEINRDFEVQRFDYSELTGILNNPPSVASIAELFSAFLDGLAAYTSDQGKEEDRYIDITLVGHSMGGLIIQRSLIGWLEAGRGRKVARIRQVIQFATPNFGSGLLKNSRLTLGLLIPNAQDAALGVFSEETRAIEDAMRERVVFVQERGANHYPVPFHCFWGEDDRIVNPVSARGIFASGSALPGGHMEVHRVAADKSWEVFRDALLHPHGHANVTEVEAFRMEVKVWPLPTGTPIQAHHGVTDRVVVCDNAAHVLREVTFGANNICRSLFDLKYGTRNGGWMEVTPPAKHNTPKDRLRFYHDNGVDAFFCITPEPRETATLECVVYKGFDAGHRDFHMHLGRDKYFRRISYQIDLTEYVKAGWGVTPPALFYQADEPEDHALCEFREKLPPDPAHEHDPAGIWKWDLEFVREGVVDFAFEVTPPARPAQQDAVIRLAEGEHVLFGYGSLLSVASMERTLQRKYEGPFVTCRLPGWRRTWDVAMANQTYFYRTAGEFVTPSRIFYLNIRPQAGSAINGVVFVLTQAELAKFDERESVYDRVDVTDSLEGVRVEGGRAWAYRAKPECVFAHPASPRDGAIRKSYLDILAVGHRDLGPDFQAEYEASTDAPLVRLIVEDERE